MKKVDCINYAGNVEGREIMYSDIDVVVCDGFSGNIATKSIEGCGKAVGAIMSREFKRNPWTKLCAMLSMGIIKKIKKMIDDNAELVKANLAIEE